MNEKKQRQAITASLAKKPPPVPPGKRKLRIFDSIVTGFLMEVWPTGGVTFWLRYTTERGQTREVKLGKLGDVTVDQARKKAKELRAEVALKGDPAAEKERRRAVPSFAAFVTETYLPYVKERLRSYRDHESFCRLRLVPLWGPRALDSIAPADVVDLQRNLREDSLSDATVNRYTALVRRIFNLALRWEVVQGKNPAQHADMLREHGRERFLTAEETRRLFQALDAEPSQIAAACIALLALTGARKGEALSMRWEDVDLARRTWRVPRAKSGRKRHIPLSDAAATVLLAQPRHMDCPWVFPGSVEGQPLENVRKCWERVRKAAGLPSDLRIHDLRHSFASTLVNHGRPIYEVAEILGHTQLSTTRRYAHLQNDRLVDAANIAGRLMLPVLAAAE
ncbi:MAG TPA: site-specific integrase [Magnetospirillum sp.]|nr:site-specific integrase [Magnetospirillum sp.]